MRNSFKGLVTKCRGRGAGWRRAAFQRHLEKVRLWLCEQPNISVLYADYSAVLASPCLESSRISVFLGHHLNLAAMAAEVDGTLHREKSVV
jgi:hypothetical protein